MRLVLLAAIGLTLSAFLTSGPVHAGPENWAACTAGASSMRALRECSTLRDDISACQALRAAEGVDAPAQCIEAFVDDWTALVTLEDQAIGPIDGRLTYSEWLATRQEFCRDPEEIRLSIERLGEAHASFEAAKCELRQTVRRAIDAAAYRRGLR